MLLSAFLTNVNPDIGVTIGTSQLTHLLGIEVGRRKYWWQTMSQVLLHLDDVHAPTFALGGTLLCALLLLKQWKSAGAEVLSDSLEAFSRHI